ncbi:MAG: leucine-rich repeat protein [Oscillospiraceae bacterium]
MSKKLSVLLLALALTLSLCAVPATAAASDFTIENGVLTYYTGIGGAVTIPGSVTEIGDGAFRGCTGLTSVTIPNSVTTIRTNAFYDCTGLSSITIPNSVTEIGHGAFCGCTALTSVTIPTSVTEIGSWTFSGCTNLTGITIPNSVTTIGICAFSGCTNLTGVTIPNSVTEIAAEAFSGCPNLTLHGSAGSYAQTYAKENSIPFVADKAPTAPVVLTAYAAPQTVLVDGKEVKFTAYALKDANGNMTNYFRVRDVASVLNGTAAQFAVTWDGAVNLKAGTAYTADGSEMTVPFAGNQPYKQIAGDTLVSGAAQKLAAITLTDAKGNGYTYYKLRDLGSALGFKVDWNGKNVTIATTP